MQCSHVEKDIRSLRPRRRSGGLGVLFGAALLLAFSATMAITSVAIARNDGAAPADFRRPEAIPFPESNPFSIAKAELGRRLFFDPRLSGTDTQSCASCHDPAQGFEDGRSLAVGSRSDVGTRSTPTLWDAAWGVTFFWDGRAASLEDQALGPIRSKIEMDQDLDLLIEELEADPNYPALFAEAFPEEPRIAPSTIAKAIATYERTLQSPPNAFDRFVAGDESALSPEARRGFDLFVGKAGCAACHSGWALTDHAFHDIGLPAKDPGRGGIMGEPGLHHAFKTPSLREIGRRTPYMHDGSLPTLAAVVDHYRTGAVIRPTLSPDLLSIRLSDAEAADLVAFLGALDSPDPTPPSARTITVASVAPMPVTARIPETDVVTVSQRDRAFSADHVTVPRGGRVIVRNDDVRRHNIRIFNDATDFNSGIQKPGESVSIDFQDPGRFDMICGIHPRMRLTVTVAP